MKEKPDEHNDVAIYGTAIVEVTRNKNGTIRRRRIDPRKVLQGEVEFEDRAETMRPLTKEELQAFQRGLAPVKVISREELKKRYDNEK